MNPDDPGYLYALKMIATTSEKVSDYYRMPVGIRTVEVKDVKFLINGKPFYFLGFGKHEDADVRGKGLDYPLLMKDINLIKWLGANSFRTSHYPYSEELMDLCDQHGIVVIDESPAVGLHYEENFANQTLEHHLQVMYELIQRDKNRPSAVIWSLANEPHSSFEVAVPYFKTVANYTRTLDPTRPIMFADNMQYDADLCTKFMDIITINRYYSWYDDQGHTETIATRLATDLENWFRTHGKPMMLTEYGAGTVAGLHRDPATMFTEDYQMEVLLNTWPVFDQFRGSFFIGEMIWNFADFQTAQTISRVDGNKKGILTRWRQPKPSARLLRQRYLSLGLGVRTCFDPGLMGFSGHPFCTP
jgi:beta-glucuronidase